MAIFKKMKANFTNQIVKDQIGFEQLGINMIIRITSISSVVSDSQIENNLNQIISKDSNLIGIRWGTFRNKDWLELWCLISTRSRYTIPTVFYEHYSRLLSEVYMINL